MRTFDNLIIGFGKGGKTLAAQLAKQGQSTLVAEKSVRMYGGSCINIACLPTKSLENSARNSVIQGGDEQARQLHFYQAIEEKRRLTSMLRKKNYDKLISAGVEVIDGEASFLDDHHVRIRTNDKEEIIEARRIFINTGAKPVVPDIAGLKESRRVYLSESLMELETLPQHLVILGSGYIGLEFASMFANFGSQITLLQPGGRFLPREDAEIAAAVEASLSRRGVRLMRNTALTEVRDEAEETILHLTEKETAGELRCDALLVATGRRPQLDALHPQAAGIALTARGAIAVDEHLKTSVDHIWAMGDVTGGLQFTYISLDDSRIVHDALTGGSRTTANRGAVPYSVFMDPPFSRVGMSEEEARQAGYEIKIAKIPAAAIPKAQVLRKTEGLLKAVMDAKTDQILGAHLFCEESHEMINLVKLAMDARLPYTVLRDGIYTHPTMSESLNDLFAAVNPA